MRVASIDTAKLVELCNAVRKTTKMSAKERLTAVTAILKAADIVRQTDTEDLICLRCASALRGHAHESTIFRMGETGRLTIYSICHKNYFSKSEVLGLPAIGSLPTGDRKANRR